MHEPARKRMDARSARAGLALLPFGHERFERLAGECRRIDRDVDGSRGEPSRVRRVEEVASAVVHACRLLELDGAAHADPIGRAGRAQRPRHDLVVLDGERLVARAGARRALREMEHGGAAVVRDRHSARGGLCGSADEPGQLGG